MSTTGAGLGRDSKAAVKPLLHVLLVEDDDADRDLVLHELAKTEFEISSYAVQTANEFRKRVKIHPPDVVLSDYNLGSWRGTEAVEILKEEGLDIPLILISGALGDVSAVECIKQGVTDYVLKDSLARLAVALPRALKDKKLRDQRLTTQASLAQKVEELARANRDLEHVTYVASHDLQEALRMVSVFTERLAARYRGKLDPEADRDINFAVEGAVRMGSLIRDLVALSGVGRGATNQVTDCNEILRQVIEDLRGTIRETSAIIERGQLPLLTVSRSELKQVFHNLIENSIKFHSAQFPVIHISAERRGTEWSFSVADNGIGIATEYIERVFIIFQRLHARSEYPGNGIGLTIAKKIVERHGGMIEAMPREGGGTVIRFTLPAA